MRDWVTHPAIWAGALGTAGLVYFRREVVDGVKDMATKGNRLSFGTFDEAAGIVLDSPETLRQAASTRLGRTISKDAYAGARMIRSEGAAQGLLRIHVALNDLESFRYASTLFQLLTYSTDPMRKGVFGKQYSPAVRDPDDPTKWLYPNPNKRRYATRQDPYAGDVAISVQGIEERLRGIDRVNGATKFIDVKDMGVQEGSVSFAQKDAEWKRDGYVSFTLREFGPDFVLYKRA